MSVPSGYDPITFNHWLWYKYLCHEAAPNEFQRLFENIMKRARPKFTQIRPYGRIGDRKADGLLAGEGTVYQVYSPDTLTQAKVIEKIDEDLEGALEHWEDEMKQWVFVYNARRGLAPDIPRILMEKQREYPQVEIDHLSSDALWEIARDLPLQQRAEVLGAPTGYEEMFLVPDVRPTPTTMSEPPREAWIVLIQDVLVPIDVRSALRALDPASPIGAPVFIRPDTSSWDSAAEYQRIIIADVLAKSRRSLPPRFAVFSIAPIPLVVQLGFLLTDSVPVRLYKFHIDTKSWEWPQVDPEDVDLDIQVEGVPQGRLDQECDVLVRISLSARIEPCDTEEIAPGTPVQVDIFVDRPSRVWIRSRKQLTRLAEVFRGVVEEIRFKIPRCQRLHLFYAGPAPGAVVVGQQINPRMDPPVHVYEYSRQRSPRYELAAVLRQV